MFIFYNQTKFHEVRNYSSQIIYLSLVFSRCMTRNCTINICWINDWMNEFIQPPLNRCWSSFLQSRVTQSLSEFVLLSFFYFFRRTLQNQPSTKSCHSYPLISVSLLSFCLFSVHLFYILSKGCLNCEHKIDKITGSQSKLEFIIQMKVLKEGLWVFTREVCYYLENFL